MWWGQLFAMNNQFSEKWIPASKIVLMFQFPVFRWLLADGAQLKFHFPIKPSFNPILMMLFRRNSKDIRDSIIFLPQRIMRMRQLIILVSDDYSTFILKKSGIDLIWSIVNEIMKNYFWSICSWAGTFFQLSVCPSLFVCLFFCLPFSFSLSLCVSVSHPDSRKTRR